MGNLLASFRIEAEEEGVFGRGDSGFDFLEAGGG